MGKRSYFERFVSITQAVAEKMNLKAKKGEQVKSFNTARMVKQMSTLMLKYAIYAFSVEKQLKSVLNI